MAEQIDMILWQKILGGDKDAFSQLYLSYRPMLIHYGFKLCQDKTLIEECLQDLFCKLYFQKNQPPIIRNMKTYLLVSFRRELIQMLIKRRKSVPFQYDAPRMDLHLVFSCEDFLIEQEQQTARRDMLAYMLNKLSPRQREIIYLRYYNGLDNEEIATVLGISYQVVTNIFYKAFKRLRAMTPQKNFPTFF